MRWRQAESSGGAVRILPKRIRKWPVVLAMTVTGVLTLVGCGGSSSTSSNVTATPTTSSPQCGLPTTVFKSEFLQAIAVAPGKAASQAASAGYTINLSGAPIPDFSPAGG